MRCPNCGAELNLTLTMESKELVTGIKTIVKTITFRMKGIPYTLTESNIIEAANALESPDIIRDYFVKLMGKSGIIQDFPIKQVVRKALITTHAEKFSEDYFTSQRAKHVLEKMGFAVNKKP